MSNEVSDDLAKEGLDKIRVYALFLGPAPSCCEHFALAVGGLDVALAALEANCRVDVLLALADRFDYGVIQPVDLNSDLCQGRAIVGRIHRCSLQ